MAPGCSYACIGPGSLKQYVNAYRREHGTAAPVSIKKRSAKKPSKKKSSAKVASGESSSAASVTVGQTSRVEEAVGAVASRTKKTSDEAPDGFLEMAKDL